MMRLPLSSPLLGHGSDYRAVANQSRAKDIARFRSIRRTGSRSTRHGRCFVEAMERRVFLSGGLIFSAAQTFATGIMPFSISVADLIGDGKPDVVVAGV